MAENLRISADEWPKILLAKNLKNFGWRLAENPDEHDEQQPKMLNSLKIDPKIQALIPIVSPNNS